ncbi:hypothetical protein Tco_0709413 [Tanacetum coccineum]
MPNDEPMWGNNRAVAPTPGVAIITVDLGDNFTVKGHHLSMIKDRTIRRKIGGSIKTQTNPVVELGLLLKDPFGRMSWTGLGLRNIIQIILFFSMDKIEQTQAILDAGGIFLYKTNEAHPISCSRIEFFLNSIGRKKTKLKTLKKTIALAESEEYSPLLAKMEALTKRIDSQFKEIKGDMKEMRDGCNKCRGPHRSSDFDDKPMGGPKEEEANFASG